MSEEQVLVVPTAVFHELGHFQGFSPDAQHYLDRLLTPELISFRPRATMEQDPSFKQLIPYVILRNVDERGTLRIFYYTRGKGQGEGRLHLKRSIGIGGHINPQDAGLGLSAATYTEGMRREIEEEVFLISPYTDQRVGLINDDLTDVGRVHLGIVHVFDMVEPAVRPRETDIAECGFATLAELMPHFDRFETWSQICLKALFM